MHLGAITEASCWTWKKNIVAAAWISWIHILMPNFPATLAPEFAFSTGISKVCCLQPLALRNTETVLGSDKLLPMQMFFLDPNDIIYLLVFDYSRSLVGHCAVHWFELTCSQEEEERKLEEWFHILRIRSPKYETTPRP